MGKLIRFVLVLAIGMFLGFILHDPIDVKVKDWFGTQRVEKLETIAEDGFEKSVEKVEARKEAKKIEKGEE